MKLPTWLPVLIRLALAFVGLYLGVKAYFDGYSSSIIGIASGIIMAELVGAHLTAAQAREVTATIEDLMKRLPPPPGAPPPAG